MAAAEGSVQVREALSPARRAPVPTGLRAGARRIAQSVAVAKRQLSFQRKTPQSPRGSCLLTRRSPERSPRTCCLSLFFVVVRRK